MIPYWLSRTELLLGAETVGQMMDQHVLVVGLGGVGGICAEMIARGGVSRMTIVDADVVELSNCNRQIPALHSNEGRKKAEVMAERLKDINPNLQLRVLPMFLDGEKAEELFRHNHYDYAVDCIDTLSAKVAFLKTCLAHQVPVVSSLGAGGKVDPSQVQVADISKTHQCKLAQAVRKKLHESGIYTGFKAVFSPEQVDQSRVIVSEKAFPKKSLIGTISYMPAIFGCVCASVVLRDIMKPSETR